MNYTNHNLIQNYGYEIYRPDGTLRVRSFSDNWADKEGSLNIELRDKNNKIKQKENKPIRSFTHFFLQNLVDEGYIPNNKPSNSGAQYNLLGTKRMESGIYLCNKSGDFPSYTYDGGTNINYEWNKTNFISMDFNSTTNTIDISMEHSGYVGNNSGTINCSCIGQMLRSSSIQPFISDAVNITYQPYERIKVRYDFKFPSSTQSTLTKAFFQMFFAAIIGNENIVCVNNSNKNININGIEIGYGDRYYLSPSNFARGYSDNQITKGIVLGSSDTNVSWDDNCLKSIFSVSELKPLAPSGDDMNSNVYRDEHKYYIKIGRKFVNISDHDITVKEAGVYSLSTLDSTSIMLARWVTGDVVVHPQETIRTFWMPTIIED